MDANVLQMSVISKSWRDESATKYRMWPKFLTEGLRERTE